MSARVFTKRVLEDLPKGAKMATGHVRYATSGRRTRSNAQPMLLHHCKGTMAVCHNGNLVNAAQLRRDLELKGSIFHGTSDTEVIGYILTQKRLTAKNIETAVSETTMDIIKGAYSLVIMSHTKLIAARDPNGFRPLCIGELPNGAGWAFASESCALDAVGARFVRDVRPGEIVVADRNGLRSIGTHCGKAPPHHLRVRVHLLCPPRLLHRGHLRPRSPAAGRTLFGAGASGGGGRGHRRAGFRPGRRAGLRPGERHPLRHRLYQKQVRGAAPLSRAARPSARAACASS